MKEGNTKRSTAVWVTISGGVLIAAALIALYTPWLQLCDVRRVVVVGNHHAAAAEVASLSRISRNDTIFSVSLTKAAQRILEHPWVRNAVLKREFPHTLRIEIEERDVVAWSSSSSDDAVLLIGDSGVLLELVETPPDVLEIEGARTSTETPGYQLLEHEISSAIERLQFGVCGLTAARLNVEDLRSIELFLDNGPQVRLGDSTTLSDSLDALDALCGEIDISNFEQIDLRFGGEATLVP